jgi:hypothetical protein
MQNRNGLILKSVVTFLLSVLTDSEPLLSQNDKADPLEVSYLGQTLNTRNMADYWQYLQRERSSELNNSI